jgi:uncharacterized membrane protein (UPF0127 family)
MRTIKAKIGGAIATLEVADKAKDRAKGFMFRESCPKNHGILFLYDASVTTPYTMKNVKIPLSIAMLDENMRIIEVIDMQPGVALYKPSKPYRYAVEMPFGWFDDNCKNSSCVIPI